MTMRFLRATHRLVTVVIVAVTIYLAFTGSMVQLIDLRSIFTKAPASDPNVMAMREAFDGPGNYAVRTVKDYTAPALPANADLAGMLSRTMESARLTVENTPLRYVELRMADSQPVGIVESAGRLAEFDATTGQIVATGPSARTDPDSPDSQRNTWKHLHRMTVFGQNALYINVVVGVGLSIMIVTGLIIYFKMLSGRSRSTASSPFWSGGGWWRTWHRRISILAALFLVVVSLSGLWLAYESLVFGFYMGSAKQRSETQAFATAQRQRSGAPQAPRPDPMSPQAELGRLAAMQHDIGLTGDEMVKVKVVTDNSVKKYLDLHQPGIDPQEARTKTMASHQEEANAIMAILTDDEKPKFQAWRDAQLLGTPPARGQRGGGGGGNDPSSPLKDAELPNMLKVTLDAERAYAGDVPVKVVRLRYYAGMPQGVVVTGGDDNKQMVFNAQTGRAVSETEPGYPPVGFPFGWQAHQLAKDVHRGGIIGVTGRFMDLFAGLAMFYLSISGIWIYVDLWKRRRKSGKSTPVWV